MNNCTLNNRDFTNPIRQPVRIMSVPCEFNFMRPHNIPINSRSIPNKISNEVNYNTSCTSCPYRTLNTMYK